MSTPTFSTFKPNEFVIFNCPSDSYHGQTVRIIDIDEKRGTCTLSLSRFNIRYLVPLYQLQKEVSPQERYQYIMDGLLDLLNNSAMNKEDVLSQLKNWRERCYFYRSDNHLEGHFVSLCKYEEWQHHPMDYAIEIHVHEEPKWCYTVHHLSSEEHTLLHKQGKYEECEKKLKYWSIEKLM